MAIVLGRKPGGGGGGAPSAGSPVIRGPFAFAYDTPNINNGVPFYTPTVGEILVEMWVEVITAFDGTTPKADISQFTGTSSPYGLWGWNTIPFLLDTTIDSIDSGGGPLVGAAPTGGGGTVHGVPLSQSYSAHQRYAPARFVSADPLLLVVSQDGLKGGAAIGGSQGSGNVYLITGTPVAL